MNHEFTDFLSSESLKPPKILEEAVFSEVHKDLFPSFQRIFLKALGVHAVVSLFSLSICSQFGLQIFPLFDLMDYFMKAVGHTYCLFLCGALYLGVSALALSVVLQPEEIRAIRRQRFLQFTLLAGFSLGVFLCTSPEILIFQTVLWMTGAVLSATLTLEIGWAFRTTKRGWN